MNGHLFRTKIIFIVCANEIKKNCDKFKSKSSSHYYLIMSKLGIIGQINFNYDHDIMHSVY